LDTRHLLHEWAEPPSGFEEWVGLSGLGVLSKAVVQGGSEFFRGGVGLGWSDGLE
jgi:hypothetical protein